MNDSKSDLLRVRQQKISKSDLLRVRQEKIGGGKGISSIKSKLLESNLFNTVKDVLIPELQKLYPNINFNLERKIYKSIIAHNMGKSNWQPESKNPFILPDGGVLYAEINGIKYPILVSEAKQQGTNDKRIKEGKKKQSLGNAVERSCKNYEELKRFFRPYDYFPYHMFFSGCDFVKGSSIIDRLDVLTDYEKRNTDYTFCSDSLTTVWMREKVWTMNEIYAKLYYTSVSVIEHILMDKLKGKNFSANNATGKRRKSDFYETPYSLTRKFLDVETFDKSLTVCEPACGAGAISNILKERWDKNLVSAYDKETNFLTETGNYDYIITNPPFSLAQEFILNAKMVANKKFALLLPLSYLHGKKRFDEIYSDREFPLKKVYVFTRYPMLGEKLREDGKYTTGMMVYAWFVWERGYVDEPTISWIDNNEDVLSKKDMDTSQTVNEETTLTKFML